MGELLELKNISYYQENDDKLYKNYTFKQHNFKVIYNIKKSLPQLTYVLRSAVE